jgi:hypothetical protein
MNIAKLAHAPPALPSASVRIGRIMPPFVSKRGALTFYGSEAAPSPRRVELFMAEHGACYYSETAASIM